MKKQRSFVTGFTLLEVAMVVAIGGLLFSMGITAMHVYMEQARLSLTRSRMQVIDDALNEFQAVNGRYPCPASFILAPDAPKYGEAVKTTGAPLYCGNRGGAPPAGTSVHRTGGNATVRIGAVPVRDLGLGDEYMVDAWRNRFTYAVSQPLTESFDPAEGKIEIRDSQDDTIEAQAHYVIVSHGKNGAGAYSHEGKTSLACPPDTGVNKNLEAINCQFSPKTTTTAATDIFRQTTRISTKVGNSNYYDDYVTYHSVSGNIKGYIPPGGVIFYESNNCPDGWLKIPIQGVGQKGAPPTEAVYSLCKKSAN